MFKGCQNLTTITGTASWSSTRGTNFTEMFSGCSSLESLDISDIHTANTTSPTVNKTRTNMLAGMTSLKSLRLGANTSLVGSGLNTISSKLDSLGIWEAQGRGTGETVNWTGNGTQLMARYGLSGGVSTTGSKLTNSIIYTFHPQGTFLTNAQVHWDYNTATQTITVFADPAAGLNRIVTDATMPWLATVSKSEVKTVNFALSDMNNNPTSPVGFNIGGNTSIANLFAGYTNLTTFVGKGLMMYPADGVNVSVVDYSGLFDGCSALTSVDLTGWDMLSNSNSAGFNIRNMFNGCTSLLTVKASDRVVLFVNSSHSSGLDALNGRGNNNGVWERTNASATDPWFGTSLNLVTRYNTDTSKFRIHGEATYVFNTSYRGGRFDNDQHLVEGRHGRQRQDAHRGRRRTRAQRGRQLPDRLGRHLQG